MSEGEALPRRRGEGTAQRIAISGVRDGGEAGREKRLERGGAPALGHHAVESFVDLLSDPDQRCETTARGSGHDLAKRSNRPRGLGLRPRRRRTNDSMSFGPAAAESRPPIKRIPGLCKTPTGHARAANVGGT